MDKNYHFDKKFIPSHTLVEQLRAFVELMKAKREAEKVQWADTLPGYTQNTEDEKDKK